MARVLICEPHDDIFSLLEIVVRRLGHEPVRFDGTLDPEDESIAAAVIEPSSPDGFAIARQLQARGVALLLASIFPADEKTLALQPCAYLVKPFPLRALERALDAALASSPNASSVPAPVLVGPQIPS
jgi:DNA-binding response OmpR family regulator